MNSVLVIDDDKTTLGLLEAQLTSIGFSVSTVSSSVKGIEIAKSFSPDVILLDLMMPLMDGITVINALRKDRITKDIPVIMISSRHDRTHVIEAMRHGVVDYIVKPYDPDKLASKIRSAITHHGEKKQENLESFIEISHKGEMTFIIMRGGITSREFQSDVKKVFNAFFLKQNHGRVCVFDLRGLDEITQAGMDEFSVILSLFEGSKIKIVAGRHYGEIVAQGDIEEKAELFLSYGDLDVAMKM